MSKILVFVFLFIGFVFPSVGQNNSVVITEFGITHSPDNSAILEVYSNEKGVLFPRMTYQAMTNIEEPSDGLLVFVTDTDFKGYWFYNATDAKWVKLRNSGTEKNDVTAPQGTIIMYFGDINNSFNADGSGKNEFSSWHICNGNHGTPDLKGRFIMGATYNNPKSDQIVGYSSTNNSEKIQISMQQMYEHVHSFERPKGQISDHEHKVHEEPHTHSVKVGKRGVGSRSKNILRRKSDNKVTRYTGTSEISIDKYITVEKSTKAINFDYGTEKLQEEGEGEALENRPPYFVMVYIIKL